MPTLIPVDHDPFASAVVPAAAPSGPTLTPVDHDPFAVTSATSTPAAAAPGSMRQKAGDLLSLAADGMTLGYADKGYSWLNGTTPEQERAVTQAAADRQGWTGTGARVAGAALPWLFGGEVMQGAAGAARAVPVLGRVLANPFAQAIGTGAAVGAGDAAGHDTSIAGGVVTGAAAGLGGKLAGDAVYGGLSGLGSLFSRAPPVPTSEALQTASRDAYANAANAGVVYAPQATSRLSDDIRSTMADYAYAPELHPGGRSVLNAMDRDFDGQPVTLSGLDTLRRMAGHMRNDSANPSQAELGRRIIGRIDDFANNPRPGDVMMGDGQGGVGALNEARQLYQRTSKDSDLAEALERAQNRAGSANAGANIDNATRQQVRGILEGRKDWTPDEAVALQRVVRGTPTSNVLRQVGRLSPETGNLMQAFNLGGVALGGAAGGFEGAAASLGVPITGIMAKHAADRMTARAVANAGDLIRMGGVPPIANNAQQFATFARQPAGMLFGDYLATQRPQ